MNVITSVKVTELLVIDAVIEVAEKAAEVATVIATLVTCSAIEYINSICFIDNN